MGGVGGNPVGLNPAAGVNDRLCGSIGGVGGKPPDVLRCWGASYGGEGGYLFMYDFSSAILLWCSSTSRIRLATFSWLSARYFIFSLSRDSSARSVLRSDDGRLLFLLVIGLNRQPSPSETTNIRDSNKFQLRGKNIKRIITIEERPSAVIKRSCGCPTDSPARSRRPYGSLLVSRATPCEAKRPVARTCTLQRCCPTPAEI